MQAVCNSMLPELDAAGEIVGGHIDDCIDAFAMQPWVLIVDDGGNVDRARNAFGGHITNKIRWNRMRWLLNRSGNAYHVGRDMNSSTL